MFRLHVTSYFKSEGQSSYVQRSSYLNFVDLAGSEKISNYFRGKSIEQNPMQFNHGTRLKEGLSINKSLFNLT